MQAQNSLL